MFLGYVYNTIEKPQIANKYVDSGIVIAKKNKIISFLGMLYEQKQFITQKLYPDSVSHYEHLKSVYQDSFNILKNYDKNYGIIQNKFAEREKELSKKLKSTKNQNNYIILFASIISFISFVIIISLMIHKRKQEDKLLYLKHEQQLLRSQMNPHFIFNSLTSIQHYLYENDPADAAVYLSSFSKLMRGILESSRKNFVYLEDEFILLNNFMKLHKLRMEGMMIYEFNTADDIDPSEIKIPPMFLQPFVENSIKHGNPIDNSPLKITINSTIIEGNKLRIEIIDNGPGIKMKEVEKINPKSSYSIQITKDRIKNLNRKKNYHIKFEINSPFAPKGTKVIFEFPIITKQQM